MATRMTRPRLDPAVTTVVRRLSYADMVQISARAGVAYNTLLRMRVRKFRPYQSTVRAVTGALEELGYLNGQKR